MTAAPRPLARPLLLALLLTCLFAPAWGQDQPAEIDRLMATYHDYGLFNGTVLVADHGEVLFKKGYGWANMEWDVPNAPDVKFRLGSITKQFTATLILQLVNEGKIALDDPLTKYLPDYPAETGGKVTIHHLLTHTSGIPSYTGLPEFFPEMSRDAYTVPEFIEVFAHLPLEFEPGTQWRYNNSGYFLLGAVIEAVTAQTYEEALRARIFGPLGMNASGYDHHATILKKRAAGYEHEGLELINAPYLDMSLPYAAGSLYSTVEDLYTWDRALYTEAVLPEALKEKMFTPYMNNYGYGWNIREMPIGATDQTVKVIGHGGGINGFNTLIARVPDGERLIVLLNNTGGTDLQSMALGILAILYGEPAAAPKKPISTELMDVIREKGVAAALAHYDRMKAERPDDFDFGERELNTLGYALLRSGDTEGAIAVFERNVAAFPEAPNPYDSLGEAYMEAGRTDEAVAAYLHSLKLDPGNDNARERLRRLGVPEDEIPGEEHPAGPELSPEVLDRYVGRYELRPGFVLTVTREGTQLFAQATGQPRVEIFPSSENTFYLKVVQARLTFHTDGDGPATSLTLHQGGREMPGKRIE